MEYADFGRVENLKCFIYGWMGWDGMGWMDGMGWDGSPGGPRYRAPTVLISRDLSGI